MKDGSKISFVDFYKQRYKLTIKDSAQPLLVSMPKLADQRRGFTEARLLVPELCYMTGLSDEQRANFKLMKARGSLLFFFP